MQAILRAVSTCVVEWIERWLIYRVPILRVRVSTCVVEWIERYLSNTRCRLLSTSPPVWWSGLKGNVAGYKEQRNSVSTCVVEWIERMEFQPVLIEPYVSTCVVEWIESPFFVLGLQACKVSTCVVEWIERGMTMLV